MSTLTIGVDLAKSVFSVCAMDGARHVQRRQDLGREVLALWLAQLPAGTVVAMKAAAVRITGRDAAWSIACSRRSWRRSSSRRSARTAWRRTTATMPWQSPRRRGRAT